MLVCHCRNVSDAEIRSAVREGAKSRRQITRRCGAGGRCGGCRQSIEQILTEERTDDIRTASLVLELIPAS